MAFIEGYKQAAITRPCLLVCHPLSPPFRGPDSVARQERNATGKELQHLSPCLVAMCHFPSKHPVEGGEAHGQQLAEAAGLITPEPAPILHGGGRHCCRSLSCFQCYICAICLLLVIHQGRSWISLGSEIYQITRLPKDMDYLHPSLIPGDTQSQAEWDAEHLM